MHGDHDRENSDNNDKRPWLNKSWLHASSIGLVFGLSIVIGTAIGYWLDALFGTKPILTLIFMALGIVAGFKNAFDFVKRTDLFNDED